MDNDSFSKSYEAKSVESSIYSFWEEAGFFKAKSESDKEAYTIVMPPPNVTGVLHMGHALVNTLQDILIRYKRKKGYEACWLPGTDHAGIATQSVVEKHLKQTTKKSRTDFSREEFLGHVWDWKNRSEKIILSQLRQLGCSCDWDRQRFTMDHQANLSVRKAFKKLYDNKKIYRGDYLVNWDPHLKTALADDEVEYEEKDGFLYYVLYPVDKDTSITVATTRPETILGDTAIAVHPDDERYKHLIGKHITLVLSDRKIPIISDYRVDKNFGSGAVKITPAHDRDDYAMGVDHQLPMINILTPNGYINENGGAFVGLTKEQAREAVIKALDEKGLLVKKEPHVHRVGVSYRSGAVIEPYLSKQWFVDTSSFVDQLQSAVESGDIVIHPIEFKRNYLNWVKNLRHWCISRQLWWGHQIPIWYNKYDENNIICFDGEGVPDEVAQDPENWYQDPDVLDTWFSSGIWPLTCLGWPDEDSLDLKKFYPTQVLITGHDILFFWVTRMVLMCSGLAENAVPFENVFLHGLIFGKSYKKYNDDGEWFYVSKEEKESYDKGSPLPKNVVSKWEKLSKSKGNVIDPIEMIELYGADAIRMTLCSCANRGDQIDLDYRLFEEYKNFANKIWNGARFIFQHIQDVSAKDLEEGICEELLDLEDYYILRLYNDLIERVDGFYDQYAFDKIALSAYEFFKNDLCSTYIEVIKPTLFGKQGTDKDRSNKKKLLIVLLLGALGILHPIVPFITEELFLKLKNAIKGIEDSIGHGDLYTASALKVLKAPACIVADYPTIIPLSRCPDNVIEEFSLGQKIVYIIRNIRGEMQIAPSESLPLYITHSDSQKLEIYFSMIRALCGIDSIQVVNELPNDKVFGTGLVGNIILGIEIPSEYVNKEISRLGKEQVRLEKSLDNVEKLLANRDFIEKANPDLIKAKQQQLDKTRIELDNVIKKVKSFTSR